MSDPLSQLEARPVGRDSEDTVPPAFDFGIWPDIFGLVAVVGIMWVMFHFADGIL